MGSQENKNNKDKIDNPLYQSLKSEIERLSKNLEDVNKERDAIIKKATVEIDKKRNNVQAELVSYQQTMEKHFPEVTYPDKGWKEKIIWALKTYKTGMTVVDIMIKIRKYEELNDVKLLPALRLTIDRMYRNGLVNRQKSTDKVNYLYGFPEWFDNDDKLLDGYM